MSLLTGLGRAIRSLWGMLGITLLVVLLLDLALRSLVPEPEAPAAEAPSRRRADAYAGQAWVGPYFDEFHDSRELRWEPYVYWRRSAHAGDYIRVDERGLRHTWNPPLAADAPRVYVMGGSTVWGSGTRDLHTLPSELSRELSRRGTPAEVVNYGESGFVSTQSLVALMLELRAGRIPDQVVMYEGVNDVVSALRDGSTGIPQNEENRRAEFNLIRDRGRLLLHWLDRSLKGAARLRAWLGERTWQPPRAADVLGLEIVETYVANQRLVRALAAEYGFGVRFYWQPSIYSKQHLSEYEQRVEAARPARGELFDAAEAAIAASPALRAEPRFRDLSRSLDGVREPLFIDFCHLSEPGNVFLARVIADDLGPELAAASLQTLSPDR